MKNFDSIFHTFYRKYVALSDEDRSKLINSFKINIKRLKEGLSEYNKEKGTSYTLSGKPLLQGSISMDTAVQNENNDFDIDIAVVFKGSTIGDLGPGAFRNAITEALKKKSSLFKQDPITKTSCIRVLYAEGYHVDFSLFKKVDSLFNGSTYYIASYDWINRDPHAINEWFSNEVKKKGKVLKEIIRLSKMFCKSRDNWIMPTGLVQTILVDTYLVSSYDTLYENFYYTMKAIASSITEYTNVLNPTNFENITYRESDKTKIKNYKNRLDEYLGKIDINSDTRSLCSQFKEFFNNEYFDDALTESVHDSRMLPVCYDDTEEFADNKFIDIYITNTFHFDCIVSLRGCRPKTYEEAIEIYTRLPHDYKIVCTIPSDVKEKIDYDEVYWKVRNVGPEAERRNDIRGQIMLRGESITETSLFYGNHYIECYLVKNGVCIAIARKDILIGEE